jgi:hypothetical protein
MTQIIDAQQVLSQEVIPAVPGEFYAYSSEFTVERPLYVLMKCKANKSRPVEVASKLGKEVNLIFLFDSFVQARVDAIKTAHARGLLGNSINGELFGETWIAEADITTEDFHNIKSRKNVAALVRACMTACSQHKSTVKVKPGSLIAIMTDLGKYGIFLVEELTPTSIEIDACHILL